jgi:hypothetical protein
MLRIKVLNLVYELPESGTDIPKRVAVVKNYTHVFVIYRLVITINILLKYLFCSPLNIR